MKRHTLLLLVPLALLSACASMYPDPDYAAQERVSRELASAAASTPKGAGSSAMPPAVLSEMLLPSIQSLSRKAPHSKSDQRFDLVVNDAPIAQVLSGLVAGTDYSILLKPVTRQPNVSSSAEVLETRVSLNIKNVTLFQALDALRDVYGYDYSVDKQRILVQAAQLQTQLFHVNYILGQRRGVSDLQVIGGASVGHSSSSSSSGGSSSTSSSYASVQASGLSTTVKSDIWGEAEDALRTLLGCNIPKAAGGAGAARGGGAGQANASRADVTHPGDSPLGERMRGSEGCAEGRALTINQMSGTILARGMPSELRMVANMLKSMQLSISRQVIIESKIIDVVLNKDSQQGINWGSFPDGLHRFSVGASASNIGVNQAGQFGGAVTSGTTLGKLLGLNQAPANAMSGATGIAMQTRNFSALINFLESQGRVHVLSSPRIATLNNQKAVIKVGSEEPFVTNITGGSTTVPSSGAPITVDPTLTYQPFFSGIALDVTPQIDAEDNITLHVHSMVNSVIEKAKLALPNSPATVPFAVNTVNETDSVVKAKDGQVIVIGGLMTESSADVRRGVPGARDIPGVGAFFNWGAQTSVKRELVILLKSTVVKDDSAWTNDISATGERVSDMSMPR